MLSSESEELAPLQSQTLTLRRPISVTDESSDCCVCIWVMRMRDGNTHASQHFLFNNKFHMEYDEHLCCSVKLYCKQNSQCKRNSETCWDFYYNAVESREVLSTFRFFLSFLPFCQILIFPIKPIWRKIVI